MKQPKSINDNIPKNIFELLKELKTQFALKQILLFGSRARGDHRDRSDIDLAISAPEITEAEWHKIEALICENEVSLLKIDLVWLENLTDETFKTRILREGVPL